MDRKLREDERAACQGDPVAEDRLLYQRRRIGDLCPSELGERWARAASKIQVLWAAAGDLTTKANNSGELAAILQKFDFELEESTWAKAVRAAVRVCQQRTSKEWKGMAFQALGVLGNRALVRRALGLKRMPNGTSKEEERLFSREWRRYHEKNAPTEGREMLQAKLEERRLAP